MNGFGELMSATGDILGIEGLEPDAGGVCVLTSEEAELLIIDCPEAGDMVLITATLMPVPNGGGSLAAALKANDRFKATRGGTISLECENDRLALSRYVPIGGLTPDSLVALLEEFTSALLALRAALPGEVGQGESWEVANSEPKPESVQTVDADGLTVELAQYADCTLASAGLGEAPADDTALWRELLEANHLFAGTAGATLSLGADGERVFLQQKLYPQEGDDNGLARQLAVFAGCAREWKARLGGAQAPSESIDLLSSGFMQV